MIVHDPRSTCRRIALLTALLVAGCTGAPFDETGPSPAPAAAAAAPVSMGGRWRLVSANAGACGMTFGAGAVAGTIAPEGGCPANFFTSRHWVFEQGSLTIQDHRRKPLITMKHTGARFEGALASSEVIWLER